MDFVKAFLVGGGICMIAQVVINFTDLTAGKILVVFMLTCSLTGVSYAAETEAPQTEMTPETEQPEVEKIKKKKSRIRK